MKTLVIGDIHGGYLALQQLFERAKVTTEDKLIFVGDYVDGWSGSVQVIEYLLELQISNECVFIKGNHDLWCENWLETGLPNMIWLQHGGALTLENYLSQSEGLRKKHLKFFQDMKLYHVSQENDLFIHAGFTSMHGPEKEFHRSNYNWDRTLWETAASMDKKIEKTSPYYPQRLALYREIYIGHTPTTRYGSELPFQACNVWNTDTGAAFKGKLSCIDLETKKIWQSDSVQSLYPKEKGRN